MPEKLYQAWNGPAPSTAAQVPVTTGTAIKTLLQIATPSTCPITIVEWGISFDGFAAALPIRCEIFGCTGAATVTAFTAATDLMKYNDPSLPTSLMTCSTTASGYTASGEGTPAAVKMFDAQFVAPTNQYAKQFPLGREPSIAVSTFLRIRVTAAAAVNAYCYVIWSE